MTSDVEESALPPLPKLQKALAVAGWGLENLGMVLLYPTVLRWMWTWFIVPLGAPAIGHWHAIGIILLTAWLQFLSLAQVQQVPSLPRSPFAGSQMVGKAIGKLAVAATILAGGYAAHSMMMGP